MSIISRATIRIGIFIELAAGIGLLGFNCAYLPSSVFKRIDVPDDGKLITLPYTQDAVQIQDTASDTRNTAGSLFFYEGFMSLNPQTDFFQDVTQAPEVNIDLGQFADAFVALNNLIGGRLDTSVDRQIAGGSFGLRTFENITTRLQVQALIWTKTIWMFL